MADSSKDSKKEAPVERSLLGMAIGVLLFGGGLAIFYAQRKGMLPAQDDMTTYGGIGLCLAGGAGWWLSGQPRDKAIEWLKSAGFALGLALTIRWAVAEPYRIPSGSMETTLHGDPSFFKGDRVFVNKWVYGIRWPFLNSRIWEGHKPQRWDIVVFKTVEKDAVHPTLVKRIVGMPGERIEIHDGKVFADGKALEIPDALPPDIYYTSSGGGLSQMRYGVSPGIDEFSVVPEGHYLMLGDNSRQSRDGRYFGWLPEENIVGRVACIWWPINRWRDFTGFSNTWWWKTLHGLLAAFTFVRLFIGQSWPVVMDERGKVRHLFVSFVALGLRIPFVLRWLVFWGEPKRGQLMLYRVKHESVPSDALLFGRIAGLPGEKIQFVDGRLQVNGKLLEPGEWPGDLPTEPEGAAIKRSKPITVPEGEFFLLADPPGEEGVFDSRTFGTIGKQGLLGQANAIWWPFWAAKKI
ncbi:MAG: signal peptidase I [Candidatus Hydrogenedens sp.]|nr:signal peptidase I [Candidatus Hydrogenedens sp.]